MDTRTSAVVGLFGGAVVLAGLILAAIVADTPAVPVVLGGILVLSAAAAAVYAKRAKHRIGRRDPNATYAPTPSTGRRASGDRWR